MDYKELIDELRFLVPHVPEQMDDDNGQNVLERAADAIETLLAERDALMNEIKGECAFCAFETGACVICEDGESWELRGPQKNA